MHNDGITEAVTVVLAPHYSSFSVGSYNKRAKEEADKYGIQLHHVERYYQQSKFIEYWTNKVNETLAEIPEEEHDETILIVSAHSLPKGLIERNNDPYPNEIKDTMDRLEASTNIKHVAQGWQSEGNTGTPWLGPDVQDLTRELYNEHHYKTLFIHQLDLFVNILKYFTIMIMSVKLFAMTLVLITIDQKCLIQIRYL